jgi:hypothetical protein
MYYIYLNKYLGWVTVYITLLYNYTLTYNRLNVCKLK